MKINIDFDLTPAEFRALFGLPDLQPLHKEVMDKIREKMLAGVENYDPMNFLAPYSPEGMRSLQELQQVLWKGFLTGMKQKKGE